jgi:hypothetical protein
MAVADVKKLTLYEARMYASSEEEISGIAVRYSGDAAALSKEIKGASENDKPSSVFDAQRKPLTPQEMLQQEMAMYEENFGTPMPESVAKVMREQCQKQEERRKISL